MTNRLAMTEDNGDLIGVIAYCPKPNATVIEDFKEQLLKFSREESKIDGTASEKLYTELQNAKRAARKKLMTAEFLNKIYQNRHMKNRKSIEYKKLKTDLRAEIKLLGKTTQLESALR